MKHITSADLNLLAVASVLFRHRNVSHAARELGMTQPAVSHALARLRKQFDDPFFVRTSNGVAPTKFALSIEADVARFMANADALLAPKKSFDPRQFRGRLTLSTTDYFEAVWGPKLQAYLATRAPHLQISLRPTVGQLPKKELEEGVFDAAIAGFYVDLPEGFYKTLLASDSFACAFSKKHLKLKRGVLSKEAYYAARHALVTLQGDFLDFTSRQNKNSKSQRDIVYGTYSFTGLAWVLCQSDLVLTAPRRLLEAYKKFFPVHVTDCPIEIALIQLRMIWHEQTHASLPHQWLRQAIREVCSAP